MKQILTEALITYVLEALSHLAHTHLRIGAHKKLSTESHKKFINNR
jgi:hypothetical protein